MERPVFAPGEFFQPSLVFRDKHSYLIMETVNYGRNKFMIQALDKLKL